MLKASFFNFSFAFCDFVIRSLPAKSITCKVLLMILLSLSVNFILKEKMQWERDERSLNSVDDIWRNFSARINNLFASSKLDIFIGDKSGIIDAEIKVSDDGYYELHLDTDDANAFLIEDNQDVTMIIE